MCNCVWSFVFQNINSCSLCCQEYLILCVLMGWKAQGIGEKELGGLSVFEFFCIFVHCNVLLTKHI